MFTADNSLTYTAAVDQLSSNNKCSQSTISRVLKDMNWTRKRIQKVPYDRNTPANISKRAAHAAFIPEKDNSDLVFIDESGFNLHTSAFHGYAPSGLNPTIVVPSNKGKNVSLLAAISLNEIIRAQTIDGAFDSELLSYIPNYCRT